MPPKKTAKKEESESSGSESDAPPKKETKTKKETKAKKEGAAKKKTAKVDDGKPKRPLTSYFRWAADQRAASSEKLTAKDLGTRWKEMSEEEQRPYKEAAEEEMAEYKRLIAE